MKTKLYKTYSRASKGAIADSVFVESTTVQRFAHSSALFDSGDAIVAQRTFSWGKNSTRTLRVFTLPTGDYGYRAFGSGIGDSKLALRIFSRAKDALAHLNTSAQRYTSSAIGWVEV